MKRDNKLSNEFEKKYENLLCETCKTEEETQQHIFKCKEIEKEEPKKCNLNFEMFFNGSVEEKLRVVLQERKETSFCE